MTKRRQTAIGLGAAVGFLPSARALAQGCAMCGNSFAPNDPASIAFNTSVVFLLLMPYTLLAAVGCWLYVRYRQHGSRRRAVVTALPWARGAEKE